MDNEKTQPTKVVKTWFIERGDGKIFAMDELEAWNTLSNYNSWRRNDFKIVGVSDGNTYVKEIKKASEEKKRVDMLISQKTEELNRYLRTLDNFKFELLLEDTDEKVVKVKGIIDGLKKEISDLNDEFSKGYQDIVDRAFKAEFKKAKGHIEYPRNQDILTPKGDRDKIIKLMQK